MKTSSAAAAVLLALGVFPRADAETGVTDQKIVFGTCAVRSGPSQDLGWSYVGGAHAYFEHANANGGVHGRKIDHLWYDDRYDANEAIACSNRLAQEGVFAFGFGVGSAQGAKYVQVAQAKAIPFFGLSGAPRFMYDTENRFVFAGRASYADETREDVKRLWTDLGVRRIGVIYQDDAAGASTIAGVREALAALGTDIVARGAFSRDGANVAEGYRAVKDAEPEAVILVGTPDPTAKVLKLMKHDGWRPYVVVVAGRDTLLVKFAGDAAEGVVVANPVPPADQISLPTVQLHNKLLKKYSPEATPGALSMQGFAEAMVLVEGLKRAGRDLTREGFIRALEGIQKFDSGLGPEYVVDFGPTDHQAFHNFSFSVIRKGRPVVFRDWKTIGKVRSEGRASP